MNRIGRYRVLGKIGRGGVASVYLVEDDRIGKRWAVKAIPKNHAEKEGILLLKMLDHPSLPRIVEETEDSGMYYEVMDYFAGVSLDRWAERGITVAEMIPAVQQILESVSYLHSGTVPVIHRDLKPGNFILTAEKKIKLIDFDLAVFGEQKGLSAMGTKGFAAPEQYRGVCTAKGDVYALGRTIALLVRSVRQESISLLDKRFIRQIEELCERASCEEPERRYGDAGEMLAAFEKCCRNRRRTRSYLAGGIALFLIMILAVSGRNVLRDAFRTHAAQQARSNLAYASSLLSDAISAWENDPSEAHRTAQRADAYVRATKHLLTNMEPDDRKQTEGTFYSLHHITMIVSGYTSGSVSERTDLFRECVSEDIAYEEYLKRCGNMEGLFKMYADDVTLCRMIGDTGSARRIYEKAISMPGISPGLRTELFRTERDLMKDEEVGG